MDILWQELTHGINDAEQAMRIVFRLCAATLLGAVIGIDRERAGKPAGFRTHILITLGTTVFVIACSAGSLSAEGMSRVVQGIVTGIGFLGAGTILKVNEERNIQGLTTAAGIWMTAAIGVTVGVGSIGLALFATILTLIILAFVGPIEYRYHQKHREEGGNGKPAV